MAGALEQLFFTITLLDKVSGPSKGVCESFRAMQQRGKDAFQLMGKGALGVAAAASSLNAFSGRGREFNKALGEVASLDTPTAELEKLGLASKKFVQQFGGDAAQIAASAYDIQSAIPGLTEGALAAFTYQGAMLARATKSNAATITKYQGTLYNIFEAEANKIGQAKWVEQLAGKTAHAVKIFKTTGDDMSAAFTNLGSIGQKAGVSLDEQLAVLGTLQGTMGGANAGTAYKAFLNTVGRAQLTTKSGETLRFTDESGKLLPMVQILEKIREAVGPGQLKLADQTKLMQAFGDEGGKAVLNLLDKTESLKGSIGDLQKIQDSSGTARMAAAMVDPMDQFKSSLDVVRITLGQGVLPAVNLFLNALSGVLRVVNWFLEYIPGLKYLVGGVVIAIAALTGAMSTFYIVIGGKKLIAAFWKELQIVYAWCLKNSAATHSMTFAQRLNAIGQMFWTKTVGGSIIASKLAAAAQWLYTTSLKSGAFWQKLGALYSTTLAICTGRYTLQTALATTATGGLSAAQLGLILKQKALVLWTGLTRAATIGLNIAMAALKLVMLAGVVPAAIAAGAGILAMKIPMLLASAAGWLLSGGFTAAASATWAFAAALLACPVTWIVIGIAAIVAAVAALIYYWDDVVEALKTVWEWFRMVCPNIAGLIENLAAGFTAIGNLIAGVWRSITEAGNGFYNWLGGKLLPLVQFFSDVFAGAGNIAAAIWGGIQSALSSVDGWIGSILRGLSKIPGLGFLAPQTESGATPVAASTVAKSSEPVIQDVVKTRDYDVPAGGIRNSTVNNNRNYNVEVYAPNGLSPAQLEEYLILQGA